jgi:hypothetical protein
MVTVPFVDVVSVTPSGSWTPLISNDSGEIAIAGATGSSNVCATSYRACTQRKSTPFLAEGSLSANRATTSARVQLAC